MRRLLLATLALLALPATASAFDPAATVSRSPSTGAVTFVGLPAGTADAGPVATRRAGTAREAGRAYLEGNADAFGLRGSTVAVTRASGDVVRYQQRYDGIDVLGGEFNVQLTPGRRVRSVLGEALPAPDVRTTPSLSVADARGAALAAVAKARRVDRAALDAAADAPLKIFDPRVVGGPGAELTRLVYAVLVTSDARAIKDRVYVDAHTGGIAATMSEIRNALDRTVCDAGNDKATSVAPNYPCSAPVRTEGTPANAGPAAADVNAAYDFAGQTYDYFADHFGRDSLDDEGLPLKSTVRFCDPDPTETCPYENAFWDGTQMAYGTGFAVADDVVGHELAHGVTEFTSGLFYYFQSGAINESMSDVFGELIDQETPDAAGDRWKLGEDLSIGAIRDMSTPGAFGDPDRMGSADYKTAIADSGGVHSNSGVNNKAAFLLVDGGTFNGQTITGLGAEKAAQIYYQVQTAYLTSGSEYRDLGLALSGACADLTGRFGITAADCGEVAEVVAATEMLTNERGAETLPACDAGVPSRDWLTERFDDAATMTRWVPRTLVGSGTGWGLGRDFPAASGGPFVYATSGTGQLFGPNYGTRRDFVVEQATAVAIRPGARLVFEHSYETETGFDGGVVEYTTDGLTWSDLPGTPYPGPLQNSTNPLTGRQAFTGVSNGYETVVVPLATLVGQNARFRLRIGSDGADAGFGWHVDDLRVTICDATPPETTIDGGPAEGATLPAGAAPAFAFSQNELDGSLACSLDGAAFAPCAGTFQAPALSAGAHAFRVRATDFVGNVDPTPATRTFTVAAPPAPAPPAPAPLAPGPAPLVPAPAAAPSLKLAGKPVRRGNVVTFTYDASVAGRLAVAGTARAKAGRRTRTVTLGSRTVTVTKAGRVTVRVTLTAATRTRLRTRALAGTFTAKLTPASGKAVSVKTTVRLAKARR